MNVDCRVEPKVHYIPMMLIWAIAALGVAFQFILQSTPNVMIPMLMQDLQIGEASIGFLTSNFFYTYLIFQIPAGLLIDRYGVQKVLSGSILLAAIACLLFATAEHTTLACFSRLMMGLVTAPCVPAVMSIAANRFPPQRFVILAGLAESIGMLGGALGEALLGSVVVTLGWRGTMESCAMVGVVLAILMYTLIRDKKAETVNQISASSTAFTDILRGFLQVIKCPQIWLIVFYAGLIFAILPALAGLWIVQALQDLYHLDLRIAVLGSSMIFLGTALGLPFWGWCSEKIGQRKPIMLVGTLLCLIFSSCFIYLSHLPIIVVFIALLLMGFVAAVYVLAFALVREQTPAPVRASAMGLTNMMSMIIGAPLLQPLIGVILDNTGAMHSSGASVQLAYHHALSSIIICLILAVILIFFIRETYCRERAEQH